MAKYRVRIYIDQTYDVESDCEQGAVGDAIVEMQKDGDMYYDIELLEGAEVVCPLCGKKMVDEDSYGSELCSACYMEQI